MVFNIGQIHDFVLNKEKYEVETTGIVSHLEHLTILIFNINSYNNGIFVKRKVALFFKGFTINEPTSKYGDLNILENFLNRSTLLFIIIAQWSKIHRRHI